LTVGDELENRSDKMNKSVAIITGASSGIGMATAVRLAKDFPSLVLAARSGENLAKTAELAKKAGAEALVVEGDLSLPATADAVVKRTMECFGRIDAVLNVAGAVPGIDLFEMTDAQWSAGAELKLHGARRLTIRAWDALKASKGAVVFISGAAGQVPTASAAAVGVLNAAITALAKAFADRGIADGVQVNSVSPGAVLTGRRLGMIEKFAGAHKMSVEDGKHKLLAQAGIARYGEPEDIAELMAFLVSPAARWLTGSSLRIDGGEVRAV
jgi:3-oxoacyl-[acyl-carrier protein] reductase